ncbi:nucleolar protein dao-5 [Episyrphus balteatus]|uniref:nucleolar protein dao-5 n=1 Tax=Episyrphus balteatus TaxID=286459 RepID=UPI00248599CC|nr:nucleolar protein dao-5 [Episyrphus balteatus]
MSLVAYASSSGDESTDTEDNEPSPPSPTKKEPVLNGHISDEDEDIPVITEPSPFKSFLNLPAPKSVVDTDTIHSLFEKLPEPKTKIDVIEEEDDEFLRKKATPLETTPKPKVPPPSKNLVRITIPSLKDFDDVEAKKEKPTDVPIKQSGFSSLISILPTPKSEQSFVKPKPSENETPSKQPSKPMAFVPDAVKNRRPAHNTENVDRTVSTKKHGPKPKPKVSLVSVSDSEGSDNEGGDFFSLTNDDKLPEVSKDEIAAMVSKKAAEMAKSSSKFLAITQTNEPQLDEIPQEDLSAGSSKQTLDNEAIQALMGSQAKRLKMDDIQIIDIVPDQVQPNKDEWLRTALASATTYQPTGVLTDEEPAAGTRRKHQITYLAHKAKANEAELQAMWSANRQNRRQTQNKYGF